MMSIKFTGVYWMSQKSTSTLFDRAMCGLMKRGGLGDTVVRCRAHDPRVVCSIPALATFEDSILGPGVNTNCASFHPEV